MRRFFSVFRMDMIRGSKSWLFYQTIFLVAGIQLLGVWQEIRIVPNPDVFSLYCIQTMTTTSVAVGALPNATSFCQEWRHRFTSYAVQRSCLSAYSWSKLITSAILGGTAVALGYFLFYGTLMIFFPLVDVAQSSFITFSQRAPFGALLRTKHPILFFFALFFTDHALIAAISASIATTVSGAIPNLFVVLSCPILYDYVNINVFAYNKWFSLIGVFDGLRGSSYGTAVTTLFYRLGYTVAMIALLGFAFQWLVGRRLVHG